ncbi:ligand-binding sensor domain-containing diguanylate cyclase [Kangiella sediminilitoris]|uniref:Diguanylate cyclase with beta propeller sensor n=1 Tax=Kangiella sediminilitoris TaxID=1144748 RepID=A0A1B3BAE8_9GAMM|nr:diguanylate cyclase [Kangiella sediminilitoris]AOE49734.1 Diguanylate cyclase with beta propeller sensor [Kangiella sediminilitoris]
MKYKLRIKDNHNDMTVFFRIQSLFFVTLLLSVSFLFNFSAEAATKVSERIRFHSLTIEDGLSQSTVNSITEDRFGYMWFATQDGLNRYDGVLFDQIKHIPNDASSLASPSIEKLIYDSMDTMWALTAQGIDSVDVNDLSVTHWMSELKLLADGGKDVELEVESIALMPDNTLLVVTNLFIAKIDVNNGDISRIDELQSLVDEHTIKNSLVIEDRFYFVEDSCLIAISLSGLGKQTRCLSSDLELELLISDRDEPNHFFITGAKGFATYSIEQQELVHFPIFDGRTDSPTKVLNLASHKNGYWLATGSGLKYWSNEEKKVTVEYFSDFTDHYSINNDYSMDIWKSSDGLFWLGTLSGVNYWQSEQQFLHLLQKREVMQFKRDNYTTSLLKNHKGDLWVGTDSSGLYKYSSDFSTLEHYAGLKVGDQLVKTDYVAGMLEDRYRNFWIIASAGLFFSPFGEDGFSLLKEVYDTNGKPITLTDMSSIIEARNGDIWLGGAEGFYKIEVEYTNNNDIQTSKLKFIDYTDTVPDVVMDTRYGVYTIYEDLQGYLWLGGSKGLVRFNPINSEVKLFESHPEDTQTLSSSDITVIYEDLLGVLWVGTVSGLNRVRYDSKGEVYFQRITQHDGFVDDFICSILADNSGFLWISTANGLVKFHPDKGTPANFTYKDGLQYNEFFTNADFADDDGNLYFGGINGITMFNPDEISIQKEEKELKVVSVKHEGLVSGLTKEGDTYFADVSDEGLVSIRLSSFDFINESEYRYKIDAFSDDWIMSNGPIINLHDIQNERLLIRAQIRQKSGRWGDKETALLLAVEKSFWSSAHGFLLYLMMLTFVVIGVAVYLSSYFSKRIDRQERKLKERKAQSQLLLSEKKALLYQVEDLQYSLSEQRYQSERLENQLEQLKVNDQLTGFKTKHYLKQHIGKELEIIGNTWVENDGIAGVYLGVFAVDIDNLAMINKEYGHLCGNEVLKQAAECLRTISYGTDTLVRWQGATLLILSRGIEKREQMILAEKIRSIIASRKFDLGNGASIDVTCSVGFGRFPFLQDPNEVITWDQLIYVIGRALSVAKSNSRNAWLGIFTNQFSHPQEIRAKITTDLSSLLNSGQLDYVSSIPKSNKINWDTTG